MNYNYYYNNVPGIGLTRNNLIYTSLISEDKKTFVQWYHNDTEYHKGKNEVVDSDKMDEKWNREICYLNLMGTYYQDLVPEFDINISERKIYLKIDEMDFWNRADCTTENYNNVLPDWQDQMLEIIKAHRKLGWHKYSMHPSSYFIVDGRLKSINYFFTYSSDEPCISIKEVESHIHSNRQLEMRKHLAALNIKWEAPQPWEIMDRLCWESFRTNYPTDFIERIKNDTQLIRY
jgi:hypothetical protein